MYDKVIYRIRGGQINELNLDDNHIVINNKNLYLKKSKIKETKFGVYSDRSYNTGDIIEIAPVIRVQAKYVCNKLWHVLHEYVFKDPNDQHYKLIALGFGSIYAKSNHPNIKYTYHKNNKIIYQAIRPISSWEELCIFHINGCKYNKHKKSGANSGGANSGDDIDYTKNHTIGSEIYKLDLNIDTMVINNKHLYVRKAQMDGIGLGVYSDIDYQVGDIVEITPIIHIPSLPHYMLKDNKLYCDYIFKNLSDNNDKLISLGFGSMYNTSDTPNIKYIYYKEMIIFQAIAHIKAGTEICSSYGVNWWKAHKHIEKK